MQHSKYILHIGFDKTFKMKLNHKKDINLTKLIPIVLGLSYIIFTTLKDIGVPLLPSELQKAKIHVPGNEGSFDFEKLKEMTLPQPSVENNNKNIYYMMFYGALAFFSAKAWMNKDILNIDVKPQKVLTIIDEIAKVLDGKRIMDFTTNSGHFALYEFIDTRSVIQVPYNVQENSNTPLVYSLSQTIKMFLYHIPQNIYISYVYKLDAKNVNENENENKDKDKDKDPKYVIYPQKKDMKNIKENVKDTNSKDEKIIEYVRLHNKKYNSIHKSPVINFFKGLIGYNFFKRKLGLNRFLPSPKLSPLKSAYYDFELEISNVYLFQTFNPHISSMEIMNKNDKKNMINIRFSVTSQFKKHFDKFIEQLPKEIKITKITSSLSRDNRLKKLESLQKEKGLKSMKSKKTDNTNNTNNTNECIQIFPFNKKYSSLLDSRPPEDKVILNTVRKREKKK